MIIKYLSELLYDNECVIIAGFGAFISKRHSAVIDYTNNRFTPPYKEIVFNNKLVTDDGMLADFICRKEHVSTEVAIEKIQSFVNQTMAVLEVNSNMEFADFGKITVDFKGDYIFSQKEGLNLLADSYGMDVFNCNAIYRTETYQDIKERIAVEQKQKNTEYTVALESVEEPKHVASSKPTLFRSLAYTVIAFVLLFMINWSTDKTDSNLASWNPFLYSSPNEFLIKTLKLHDFKISEPQNIDAEETEILTEMKAEVAVETEVVAVEETTAVEEFVIAETTAVEENVVAEEVVLMEEQPVSEIQIPVALPLHYFIVGGSFQTETSAEKCLDNIKKQGFENASTLDKNEKGYIRVYYESFAEKQEALGRLETIRRDYNESAWLLFQK